MKDYSINISVKKYSNIPNDVAEIVNFHFSLYKSMGTISCHSNKSSYSTEIKKLTYVEAIVLSMYAKFWLLRSFHFGEEDFQTFYAKLTRFAAPTTNHIHRFGQKSYET